METSNTTINNIDSFWQANEKLGFLPTSLPSSTNELSSQPNETLQAIASVANKLGSFTDSELEKFVKELPIETNLTPSNWTASMCEAIVRSYVNIAAHLIHRPFFKDKKSLPPVIAKPLWDFSVHVKRPPSLTYASYALSNFSTPVSPRMNPSNFKIDQTPSGTFDEEWFVAVHLSVESAGGAVVKAINSIESSLDTNHDDAIASALNEIQSCMIFANEIMPTVKHHLDHDIFTNKIRPLLYGHDQIIFNGVEGNPLVTYIGETGAQSGIIRVVDVILGTNHSDGIVKAMDRFSLCAPEPHQKYFKHIASISEKLLQKLGNPHIRKARAEALMALAEFRKTHLSTIEEYLAPQGKSITSSGTGGTNFGIWLRQMISETEESANR